MGYRDETAALEARKSILEEEIDAQERELARQDDRLAELDGVLKDSSDRLPAPDEFRAGGGVPATVQWQLALSVAVPFGLFILRQVVVAAALGGLWFLFAWRIWEKNRVVRWVKLSRRGIRAQGYGNYISIRWRDLDTVQVNDGKQGVVLRVETDQGVTSVRLGGDFGTSDIGNAIQRWLDATRSDG